MNFVGWFGCVGMCRISIQKHFQVPRHVRLAYRKACCNGQSALRKACNGVANAKAFPARLAGLPQTPKSFPRHLRDSRKRQKVSRETCGTPANTKKFLERLAGLPQTPKSFSRDLRDSRKRQKVFRETCGTPANAKKFLERLAGLPQTPKSFPRDLRDSRKSQKVSRETCGTPANTKAKRERAAGLVFPCTLSAMRLLYGWMEPVTWRSSQAISTCRA